MTPGPYFPPPSHGGRSPSPRAPFPAPRTTSPTPITASPPTRIRKKRRSLTQKISKKTVDTDEDEVLLKSEFQALEVGRSLYYLVVRSSEVNEDNKHLLFVHLSNAGDEPTKEGFDDKGKLDFLKIGS